MTRMRMTITMSMKTKKRTRTTRTTKKMKKKMMKMMMKRSPIWAFYLFLPVCWALIYLYICNSIIIVFNKTSFLFMNGGLLKNVIH